MENENMGYYDERALFVDGLGQLLKTAYLGVTALRYIYPEQSSNGIEIRRYCQGSFPNNWPRDEQLDRWPVSSCFGVRRR